MLNLTRRQALFLVGAWPVAARAGEFWDKKAPSEWSAEEIAKLTTKSPWAKEVSATMAADPTRSNRGTWGGQGPGGGGVGIPGGGIGFPGGRFPRTGGGGRMPRSGPTRGGSRGTTYKGTVRWESAEPIAAAMKTPLPEAFANHYVISVSGIPLRDPRNEDRRSDTDSANQADRQDDRLDELKQFTTLQPHGKALAQPSIVQRQENSYSTFLFGFSKDAIQLSKKDREIVFATRLGRMEVKAKFFPSQMQYHRKFAV